MSKPIHADLLTHRAARGSLLHRADEHGARFPLWQVVEGEVPPWTVVLRREAHACGLSDTALMQWLEADPDRIGSYALWSASSPLERVTAVVVDDLAESFVAAVTRMVLVGRGGIRLHEEVFLAGVRLQGRRAMAEEKAESALDQALDGTALNLASESVRRQLCELWNVPDAPLRVRLEESMQARAMRRHEQVMEQLTRRQTADTQRARDIFAAFRTNLRDSMATLQRAEEEAAAALFPDEQQRQRRRDIQQMERRFDELGDEEAREVAAIAERYAEVKPHTTAAAIVFALTRSDADGWNN